VPTKMRPFGKTIALEEARAIIEHALQPIDRTEVLPLQQANGRVLAQDVVSTVDVPPFSRAAMDGYAVRAEDTAGASRTTARTLRRIETIYTGQVPQKRVGQGECAEIATGAPMPDGADAVVMVEETDIDDRGAVSIFVEATPRQNIGRQGADIQKGQHVLQPGTLLNASRLGSIAALGLTEITVYEKPRVAILSTGNEIVDPGQPLAPGQIYDINRVTVSGVVTDNGGIPIPYRTAADTIDDLSRAVEECLEQHDEVRILLEELARLDPSDPDFEDRLTEVQDSLEQHVEEEEAEVFPIARQKLGAARLDELGKELENLKDSLRGAMVVR